MVAVDERHARVEDRTVGAGNIKKSWLTPAAIAAEAAARERARADAQASKK